jgi:hypothetical protein
MFETALCDYWAKVKVELYIKVSVKLLKMYKGDGNLDKFYVNEPKWTEVDFERTGSLFLLLLSSLLIPLFVLLLENMIFCIKE